MKYYISHLIRVGVVISFFALLPVMTSLGQISGWHWVNPLPQGNVIHEVKFYDNLTGYAVGAFGIILRTENGGVTWENIPSPTDEELFSISIITPQLFYIAGDHACYQCTNGEGTHWIKTATPQMEEEMMNSVVFINQDTGFVSSNKGNLFKTTDGGESWTTIAVGIPGNSYPVSLEQFTDSVTGYARYMFGNYFKTIDGGNSWIPGGIGIQWDIRAMRFFNSTTGVVATLNGIRRTTNGGTTWQDVNPETRVVAFCIASPQIGFAVTDAGRMLKTHDAGLTWNLTSTLPAQFAAVAFADTSNGCAAGESGSIFTTGDGGSSWQMRSSGAIDTIWSITFPTPSTGYAAGNHGVQKSTDYGNSWKTVYQTNDKSFMKIRFFSETSGNAVVYDPTCQTTPMLGTTEDGGLTWSFSAINNGNAFCWPDITSLPDKNTCFVGTSATSAAVGLYLTQNRGVTWNHITLPVSNFTIGYGMQFLTPAIGLVVESSLSGTNLFTTSDGGKNWRSTSSAISGRRVDKLFFTDTVHGYLMGTALGANEKEGPWVARTDNGGVTWSSVIVPDSAFGDRYADICFLNHDTGYISGIRHDSRYKGLILKTIDAGNTWETQIHRSKSELKSLAIIDEATAFAAGEGGTILATDVGGDILFAPPGITPLPRTHVAVFPNPGQDEVWLRLKEPMSGKYRLELYSFEGRNIPAPPVSSVSQDRSIIHIQVSALIPGTYFFRLITGKQVMTGKIVKN